MHWAPIVPCVLGNLAGGGAERRPEWGRCEARSAAFVLRPQDACV